ncbi:hypothetical protein MtrunA17_Chr6g0478051 [Medicago truncatula]|uniref:Uncharacterized protein n=1 Tax=Medicago truncatula TaxID=3880 RepID=A0A396HLM5_MEDTR|nr:hypothetical protein MtrunA17_Chr6g0478051 [Medicago truncatula]
MKEHNTHSQLHPASKFPSFLLSLCLNQFTNLPWRFPYPTSHFMLLCFKKVWRKQWCLLQGFNPAAEGMNNLLSFKGLEALD